MHSGDCADFTGPPDIFRAMILAKVYFTDWLSSSVLPHAVIMADKKVSVRFSGLSDAKGTYAVT